MLTSPNVSDSQRQILDALLLGRVLTGPDLLKRVRAEKLEVFRKDLAELVKQDLVQVSGSVNDDWSVLSSTFSIRPSDQAYVRQALIRG